MASSKLSGGSARAIAELGLAHALRGDKTEALRLLAGIQGGQGRPPVSAFNVALILGGVGDKAKALDWLEKADEERSPSLNLLKLSPAFASLRGEPRFARTCLVSDGFFSIFRTAPESGRVFAAEEMRTGGAPAAIHCLSSSFCWLVICLCAAGGGMTSSTSPLNMR